MKKFYLISLLIVITSCQKDLSTTEKLGIQVFTAFKNDDINDIKKLAITYEELKLTQQKLNNKVEYDDNFKNDDVYIEFDKVIETRENLITNITSSLKYYSFSLCYVKYEKYENINFGDLIIVFENKEKDIQLIGFEIIKTYDGNWKFIDDMNWVEMDIADIENIKGRLEGSGYKKFNIDFEKLKTSEK